MPENGELPADTFFLIRDYVTERVRARGGGRRGGGKRWCENTLLRGTVGPSFRRFNCFVLVAREGRTERETGAAGRGAV